MYKMEAKHAEEGFWPSVAEGLQHIKGVKIVAFEVKPDPVNENPKNPENDKPHFIPTKVNHAAKPIKIEAADLHGRPIAGRTFAQSTPIVGDAFRQPVKWGESDDLGVKAGEPVVLRFKMSGAKIYGLDFE